MSFPGSPALLVVALVLIACAGPEPAPPPDPDPAPPGTDEPARAELYSEGRLTARPHARVKTKRIRPGIFDLGIVATRDSRIFIPESYRGGTRAPMMLALHGANGGPQ